MAANPNANMNKTKSQQEVPISILVWLGMKSNYPPQSIPVNALTYILNCDYVSQNEIVTRMGTTEFQSDSVTGASNSIVGAINFHLRGEATSNIYEATSDGKLYRKAADIAGVPTLLGSLSTSAPLTRVRFAKFKKKLYMADGIAGWVYDPTLGTLTQMTFPAAYSSAKFKDVKVFLNKLWWITDEDDVLSSVPGDPTDYSSTGEWHATVNEDDGLSLETITKWGQTLVFTKYNSVTYEQSMYKLSGTSEEDFRIDDIVADDKNPVGFFGDSAVIIGPDVIGLTRNGFATLSAIQNFNEVSLNNLSIDIDDYIRRINWDYAYKITAIYDIHTRQYMCACPIDGASYNNIIFIYDPTGQRWGLYDNWPVRTFFQVKDVVFYGSEYGKIIKTRDGENDLGLGFNKVIEGATWHFDSPDTLKLFKSMDLQLSQDGQYDVTLTLVVNGRESKAKEIPLRVDGGNIWDDFDWDVDRWDEALPTNICARLLLRGRDLKFRLHNDQPDEPFALKGMSIRSFITDAGDPKP